MRHTRGLWVCCSLLLAAGVLAGVGFVTTNNASAQEQSASNSSDKNEIADEARWRDGELIPPLPKDPGRRAEAIRQARLIAEARTPAREPDIVIQPQSMTMESHPVVVDRSKRTTRPTDFMAARVPQLPSLMNPEERFVPNDFQKSNTGSKFPAGEAVAPASMVSGDMIKFNAIGFTGFANASPDIDVGPEHLVAVASDMVAVYDKCGNWLEGGTFLDYFGQVSSNTFFDPRVIYDDWRGRWVVVFTELNTSTNDSYLRVAVSNSSDPTEGWLAVYIISWNAPTNGFADNMYIADDPEALYITYNRYDVSTYSFKGTTISVIPKDDLYQPGSVSYTSFTGSTNPGDASAAFAIRPAQMNSWAGYTYLLNNKYQGGNIGTVWRISGTVSSPVLDGFSIGIYPYETPPAMQQPNGTFIRSLDCRYTDAVYSGGILYGARAALEEYGEGDKSAVYVDKISTSALLTNTFWMNYPGTARAFPAIDVDEYSNLILTSAACSDVMYPSFIYDILSMFPLSTIESGTIAAGVADYSLGGGGTSGNPYRWGAYSGVALDHADSRTFWTHGAFASIDPVPSWTTKIGAYAYFANSDLSITPSTMQISTGFENGFFWPNTFTYTVENAGETMANWHINTTADWLTPSITGGQLLPGASQDVTFSLNRFAGYKEPGNHVSTIAFVNCTGSTPPLAWLLLAVVEPYECRGSVVWLEPEVETYYSGQMAGEHSLFVTALEDIDLCAVDPNVAGPTEPLTVRVYEADGNTRGPLLAENTSYAPNSVFGHEFIPIGIELEACQDYEIAFEISSSLYRAYANEIDVTYPYDVAGLLRVREGAFNGDAEGTNWCPYITILASSTSKEWTGHTTDLQPDGPVHETSATDTQLGLFVGALENMRLTSLGFEADLSRGTEIHARLYEASGNTRGDHVCYGAATVETGGMASHEVFLHANLENGQDYNLQLSFQGDGFYPAVNQFDVSLPDTVDGVIEVRKAESNGYLSTNIPHFWINWDDYANGGYPFDLAKASDGIPPPFSQIGGNLDHDAFVESMNTTQVYGLGVMADIPEGEILLARIYSATETGRDALMAESLIYTSGPGMRWHDVPMAFEWTGGEEIDISFVCANVNELPHWEDSTGFPFTPYGAIQVNDAGLAGDRFYTPYVHMRVHGCDNVPTGIGDDTPSFSPMVVKPPVPNPANGVVRFDYSVDQPAVAEMAIYDVLGRRVAIVFADEQIPAGSGSAQFDASTLASGVYFLKLETPKMAVSRKFVVTH